MPKLLQAKDVFRGWPKPATAERVRQTKVRGMYAFRTLEGTTPSGKPVYHLQVVSRLKLLDDFCETHQLITYDHDELKSAFTEALDEAKDHYEELRRKSNE